MKAMRDLVLYPNRVRLWEQQLYLPPPDQISHPHPISNMVTKICHHAAVVCVMAARW
jgi:hypothetical protein